MKPQQEYNINGQRYVLSESKFNADVEISEEDLYREIAQGLITESNKTCKKTILLTLDKLKEILEYYYEKRVADGHWSNYSLFENVTYVFGLKEE